MPRFLDFTTMLRVVSVSILSMEDAEETGITFRQWKSVKMNVVSSYTSSIIFPKVRDSVFLSIQLQIFVAYLQSQDFAWLTCPDFTTMLRVVNVSVLYMEDVEETRTTLRPWKSVKGNVVS